MKFMKNRFANEFTLWEITGKGEKPTSLIDENTKFFQGNCPKLNTSLGNSEKVYSYRKQSIALEIRKMVVRTEI